MSRGALHPIVCVFHLAFVSVIVGHVTIFVNQGVQFFDCRELGIRHHMSESVVIMVLTPAGIVCLFLGQLLIVGSLTSRII